MLFERPPGAPLGLSCAADFLSAEEEAALLRELRRQDWDGRGLIRRRGRVVKRREIDFIHDYGRHTRRLEQGAALPDFLAEVRARCGRAVGEEPERFQQVIAAMYRAGAGIDWHVDSVDAFGELICGVSLGAACAMQFRQLGGEVSRIRLEPRSLLVLRGPARYDFQHRIPPVQSTRFSITLRTVD